VAKIYEIGPFRLEPDAGVLTRDGIAAPLGARAVAVLRKLVERANEYVPKAHIIEAVWPDVVVEESNLAVQIAAIRRVLSQANGERWIETLPRRGYRFVGPVVKADDVGQRERADTRTNLPQPLTSFIGREAELREVTTLLANCRLLTIVGIGGIGKTRLALRIAADVGHTYRDGVWFVDLAPVADFPRVPSTVAQVLGVRETAGKPLIATVCRHLKGQRALLVLDNCEHLLDACTRLAEAILPRRPKRTSSLQVVRRWESPESRYTRCAHYRWPIRQPP